MAGASIQVVVVTPEKAVLDAQADFVALPLYDGEVGVLPGRAPLIGRLGAGELRTRRGPVTRTFFVDGGFVQVRGDVVTVLTARAVPAEELTVEGANKALEAALVPGKTPEEQDKQLAAQARARAQLRVARKPKDSGGPRLPVTELPS